VGIPTILSARPKLAQTPPRYSPKDVSVIVPTTAKSLPELTKCLQTIAACSPAAIFIVTSDANTNLLSKHCSDISVDVTVLGVPVFNKRDQILKAMSLVQTPLCVLADDDICWPPAFLEYLLAIFEDPEVGAGGPRQRVRRNAKPDAWNFLGIGYLERRAWNNVASNLIDGSISTLSGRTAAYRTEILQTEEFSNYFLKERGGKGKPNSGDDKCLTRYVYSRGWKIVIQPDPRATIETTLEPDGKFLLQCVRWSRAHWRGNIAVMMEESYWYSRRYFWGLYYIYLAQFQVPALL